MLSSTSESPGWTPLAWSNLKSTFYLCCLNVCRAQQTQSKEPNSIEMQVVGYVGKLFMAFKKVKCSIFFFDNLLIWNSKLERERKTEILYSLTHSPIDCNVYSWVSPKSEITSKSFTWVQGSKDWATLWCWSRSGVHHTQCWWHKQHIYSLCRNTDLAMLNFN